jgi:hypothetical protein
VDATADFFSIVGQDRNSKMYEVRGSVLIFEGVVREVRVFVDADLVIAGFVCQETLTLS